MRRELYAGVMSGTSLDGVDAVVADFAPDSGRTCEVLGAAARPFPPALRAELSALQQPVPNELARAARAANALADVYAEAITGAVANAKISSGDLVAAGVHGQTLRHRPDDGWTLQLNNAARVAERTQVTVVADFRSRDVAAGGQGAPLVPAFHAALFGGDVRRVVVNLGGIANLTDLAPGGAVGRVRYRARATCCSTTGTGGIAAASSIATARGQRRGASTTRCWRAMRERAVFRAHAAEEHRPRPLQPGLARRETRRA